MLAKIETIKRITTNATFGSFGIGQYFSIPNEEEEGDVEFVKTSMNEAMRLWDSHFFNFKGDRIIKPLELISIKLKEI